jgi:hypothetical protein
MGREAIEISSSSKSWISKKHPHKFLEYPGLPEPE